MAWLYIIIIGLLLLIIFRKYLEHKIVVILMVLFFIFIILSLITVIGTVKTHSIDYKSAEGIVSIGKLYFSWIGQLVNNVGELTGNVVKMNWTNRPKASNKTIKK